MEAIESSLFGALLRNLIHYKLDFGPLTNAHVQIT